VAYKKSSSYVAWKCLKSFCWWWANQLLCLTQLEFWLSWAVTNIQSPRGTFILKTEKLIRKKIRNCLHIDQSEQNIIITRQLFLKGGGNTSHYSEKWYRLTDILGRNASYWQTKNYQMLKELQILLAAWNM
jgi:hypothetical protein